MSSLFKFSYLIICIFQFAIVNVAYAGCSECNRTKIRIRTIGNGNLSHPFSPDHYAPENANLDGQPFFGELGERGNLSFTHRGSGCESATTTLTTSCGHLLYYKTKDKDGKLSPHWHATSSLQLSTSFKPKENSPSQEKCSCPDCIGGETCRCSCYADGTPPYPIKYFTRYLKGEEKKLYVNTDPDVNPGWEDQWLQITTNPNIEFRGEGPPIGNIRVAIIYDKLDTKPVAADSRNGPPTDPDFVEWDPDSAEEDKDYSGPPTYCKCPGSGSADPNTTPPSQVETPRCEAGPPKELVVIPWVWGQSSENDTGASSPSGPSSYYTGGTSAPEVKLEIKFGLGTDSEGGCSAIFTYTGELDGSDPLDSANFKIKQPFHEPGNAPFSFKTDPAADGIKLQSNELKVTESRTADTVTLKFYDLKKPIGDQLVATHTLKEIPGTASTDPGIIHTEESAGQTRVREFYGESVANGGRTWKEVSPDGKIIEGLDSPFEGNPQIRTEERTIKQKVGLVEVPVSKTVKKFRKYIFGERLIESTEAGPNQVMFTTSYEYYEDYIGAKRGLMKSMLKPDGSWESYQYNPMTGDLERVLRPWLSEVTSPGQAKLNNCVATTFSSPKPDSSWNFESVKGVVTTRNWENKESTTKWTLGLPKLKANLFASSDPNIVINNDIVSAGVGHVRLSMRFPDGSVRQTLLNSHYGYLSKAMTALLGVKVIYNQNNSYYEIAAHDIMDWNTTIEISALPNVLMWLDTYKRIYDPNPSFVTLRFQSLSATPPLFDPSNPTPRLEIGHSRINNILTIFSPYLNYENPDPSARASAFADAVNIWITSNLSSQPKLDLEYTQGEAEVTLRSRELGQIFSTNYRDGGESHHQSGLPEVVASGGFIDMYRWHMIASNQWKWEDAATIYSGGSNVQRSQRFTADYSSWDGQMSFYKSVNGQSTPDDLQYSLTSDGRAIKQTIVKGLFDSETKSFDWSSSGGARKITTSTLAVLPSNFVILAEDPVHEVSMEDYQGLTRVEETWHGLDLIKRVIHDYDPETRERISSTENGIPIFSAIRDKVANTYTQTDASGVTTVTTYTLDGRVQETCKKGHLGRTDIVSSSTEQGLTSISSVSAGSLSRVSSTTVDELGRVVSRTDEEGRITTYVYEMFGRKVIETLPNGGTRITEKHLDGRVKSITGTAVIPEYYEYEVEESGNMIVTIYQNDDGTTESRSPRWRRSVTDGLGRLVREEVPAVGGGSFLVTTHHYNSRGQKIATRQSGQKDRLFEYDVFGRLKAEGIDLNNNGILDLNQSEPVTQTSTEYVKLAGQWWEKTTVTEWASSETGQPIRTRSTRRLLSGGLYSAQVQESSDGLVITEITTRDPNSKTVIQTRTSNHSNLDAIQIFKNGLLISAGSLNGTGLTVYDYDDLERPTLVTTPDQIVRRTVYDDLISGLTRSRIKTLDMRPGGSAIFTPLETYTYFPNNVSGAGQVQTMTKPDDSSIQYEYDLLGRQTFVSGSGTYPIRYVYNDFGELHQMHTFRDPTQPPTATSEGDVTTWTRDPATGQLLGKMDALQRSTEYNYVTGTGRLSKRTWARSSGGQRVSATYSYDVAGRLESTTYSDGTPSIAYTYLPDGRLATTSDAAGLHTYLYQGPNGMLSGETISGVGLLSGASIQITYDDKRRREGFTWNWKDHSRTASVLYDPVGRLHQVSAFGRSATYAYSPVSGRQEEISYSGVGGLKGTWVHDDRGRLDSIRWQTGLDTVSLHDYGYGTHMNRRDTVQRETDDEWRYNYNSRGEVTSAAKAQSSGEEASIWRGLQTLYDYDLIGNRVQETVNTPTVTGSEVLSWTPNSVNQITERQTPSGRWVLGKALPETTLTVSDGTHPVREGSEFAVPVERGLTGLALWKDLNITASRSGVGVNGANVQRTEKGSLWFPTSPETFSYDEDGNLVTDGRWSYSWNGENRLKSMETLPSAVTAGVPWQRLDFAYDANGRRIRKVVKELAEGSATPKTISDLRYLYDGWNLVAEFEMINELESSNGRLLRSYAWGTDLSGTSQGAGGVGGLLFVEQIHAQGNRAPRVSAPCYDGNGNVSAYVDLGTGRVTVKLDYDAFGKPIWTELSSGEKNQLHRIPIGFSTKYEDLETSLLYFGQRFYLSEAGRWINRDPIAEFGGVNLYGFVNNNPIAFVDAHGHSIAGKSYNAFKKKLREKGLSLLVQVHHKIGQEVFSHAKYGPWLRSLGFEVDESKNLIILPNKLGKCLLSSAAKSSSRRTLHEGRHMSDYVAPILGRLDEILELHRAGKIYDCDARGLVAELQKELTMGLRNGTIKLNEAEALGLGDGALNFMGLAMIHLSSTDQFIEDVKVHVSVGTYTGDGPIGCWAGEIADFFNPLTDYVQVVEDAKAGWDLWEWLNGIGRDLPGGYWPSGGGGW